MTAEGGVYQRKDGRWVAQYKDFKRKTRYIYRKTRGEAKKATREALKDRDDGYVPADEITVGMYLDEWMSERKNTVSYRTWRVQESVIRCRVKAYIASQNLCKLSGKDVRQSFFIGQRHLKYLDRYMPQGVVLGKFVLDHPQNRLLLALQVY
jgi:hypothetical protein